jgi:hypothetical protein
VRVGSKGLAVPLIVVVAQILQTACARGVLFDQVMSHASRAGEAYCGNRDAHQVGDRVAVRISDPELEQYALPGLSTTPEQVCSK